jgi:hypothetical protein
MVKKNIKNTNKNTNLESKLNLPRVSICTPTFNRRPFFKGLIYSVLAQNYPKDKIEWIIVDDGTDKVGDLVKDIPFVKYVNVEKMTLGRKRNFMHEQCTFKNDDDIIVYMDDDDYYPIDRVSHSVEKLTGSNALCAGSSEIYIWFNTLNKMYRFGPYGPNHSTAGTFAFKRILLKQTSYEDNALLAEEKHFLKDYTIPFVQLDPLKTILVISHEQNTFDKRRLINPENKHCHESALVPSTFIKNKDLLNFYIKEIPCLLEKYKEGSVLNKPEVLAEIEKKDKERMLLGQKGQAQGQPQVAIKNPDGSTRVLQTGEIIMALQNLTNEALEIRKENEKVKQEIKRINDIIINKNIQHYFI